MLRYTPEEIVRILGSAPDDPRAAELDDVLSAFRQHWLAWVRRHYSTLEAEHEDAVQEASVLVVQRIHQLRDPRCVHSWANSVFRSVLREIVKKRGRPSHRRHEIRFGDDPDDFLNRLPDLTPSTEETASLRERLRIVETVVRHSETAWLRFAEDLSEKEIGDRTGLSRDSVATVLKRIRKVLRRVLDENDQDGHPPSAARILEGSGLPADLADKLVHVIDGLLGRSQGASLSEDDPPHDKGISGRR
jgi:RNA polymerase sigma factor (sigma-70 family)